MKRAPAAELTRAELAALKPADAPSCPVKGVPSAWLGSAGSEVAYWRERALRAEGELARRASGGG